MGVETLALQAEEQAVRRQAAGVGADILENDGGIADQLGVGNQVGEFAQGHHNVVSDSWVDLKALGGYAMTGPSKPVIDRPPGFVIGRLLDDDDIEVVVIKPAQAGIQLPAVLGGPGGHGMQM